MVNIILDTNTWIYLANGYDQNTQNYQGGLHFKLLAEINQLINQGKIRLFKNETILMEWQRNKAATEIQITAKKGAIEGMRTQFAGAKKILSDDGKMKADEVFQEYEAAVLKEIDIQNNHIIEVENLIKNIAIDIPIKDEAYVIAGKLAAAKKAPFHNKANSFGDAVILLSAVNYFSVNDYEWIGNTIFVSNNSDDYSAKKGSKEIHPDLAPFLKEADIAFELNIAKALNLSQDISTQIDHYIQYHESREPCLANCKGEIFGTNIVVYEAIKIYVEGADLLVFNPNQLQLFPGPEFSLSKEEIDKINDTKTVTIEFGTCEHCYATHIRCDCGHEHYTYDDPYDISCDCGKDIYNDKAGKVKVIEN